MDRSREAMRRKSTKKRQAWGLPWFRSHDKAWYVTIRGVRHKLAKGDESKRDNNREEALKEWHRLMALADAEDKKENNPLWVIFEKFLDYTEKEHPGRYRPYKNLLQKFKDAHPHLSVKELKPAIVNKWLDAHPTWNDSSRATNVAILVTCLNWAAKPEQNFIEKNPIRGMKRPSFRSRGAEAVLDPEDFAAIFDAATPFVQDALAFLRQTGTRPGNLARITAHCIDANNRCVRLAKHKTATKTGRPLVIPLTQAALDILLRLAEKYPGGPLFRTGRGLPLTGERLSSRICDIKRQLREQKKLKGNPIAYGCRHTLATELLQKDVPDAKVAFILGHKGTAMLFHHYSHLDKVSKSIAEELDRTINGDAVASATAEAGAASAGSASASALSDPVPGPEQPSG